MQEHSTGVSMKYSKKLLEFSNNEAGFATVKAWMEEVEEKHGKDVVIPGIELTGHYWFNLGAYMQDNGMKMNLSARRFYEICNEEQKNGKNYECFERN